ncbi:MAG: PIN domain-containing protein [Planctomycetes bacterium]|nr:PIN domain-containing protein [Planctomycetota bacterium]
MFILDTDMLSLFFAGDTTVQRKVETTQDEITISIITRIELLRGRFDHLLKASTGPDLLRAQRFLLELEDSLAPWKVLAFDNHAVEIWQRLSKIRGMKKRGRADLLIASIALARKNAVLVTRNRSDFQGIPQLRIENWAD